MSDNGLVSAPLGWICARCGNSNSPLLLVCGCSKSPQQPPQTTAASTAATTANGAAAVVADKGLDLKSLEPKTPSTRKNRFNYTDPNFLSFWDVYPLKRGKAAAAKRFAAAVAAGISPQQLIAAAAAYRDDPSRKPEYTKWPEGWLNDGRWDDEADVAAPPPPVSKDDRYQPYDTEAHMRELEAITERGLVNDHEDGEHVTTVAGCPRCRMEVQPT